MPTRLKGCFRRPRGQGFDSPWVHHITAGQRMCSRSVPVALCRSWSRMVTPTLKGRGKGVHQPLLVGGALPPCSPDPRAGPGGGGGKRRTGVTLDVLRSEAERAQDELNALGSKPGFPGTRSMLERKIKEASEKADSYAHEVAVREAVRKREKDCRCSSRSGAATIHPS